LDLGTLRCQNPDPERTMATLVHDTSTRGQTDVEAPVTLIGPLVVATDGTEQTDSAIRMTSVIAASSNREVVVLAVVPPMPMAAPEAALPPVDERLRVGTLRRQVLEQLNRTGVDKEWRIDIERGDPAATIVRVAQQHHASFVIMGLGEHGLIDRLLGDETVLRVLRLGTIPVLAVAPGQERLPRRILAGLDFTPSSVRAATLAASVMSRDGTLTLAHVLPRDVDPANWKSVNAPFQGTMGRAFDLAIARIGFDNSESLHRRVLAGDPVRELRGLADELHPDLMVVGSHGRNFLTRLRLGSVSEWMVRHAGCSVLIAPMEDGPNFLDEVPAVTTRFASYEWSERLEEFTRRNAGRKATMEVIDPELGAQVEERGFPFVGASFDPRDGHVQIMVGDFGLKHLTRSITGVTAVQVLRDRAGRDMLLRVAHGRGQTLLTLER
jgi:universal stress protein E